MQKLISIWKNKSKNGNIYYSGKLGEVNIIGFENVKENEKQPDITFYIADEKKKEIPKKEEKASIDEFTSFGQMIDIDEELLD